MEMELWASVNIGTGWAFLIEALIAGTTRGRRFLLIAGMLPIRELNLSAQFFRYTEIDVVPFQQHPYESITPIFGSL